MFKEYNENQDFLLPPSFKEYLWEEHEAIILSEIINELNLNKLYNEYNKNINWKWRPAYNPKMLLKILFHWYMNQTFSSRKLANKLKTTVPNSADDSNELIPILKKLKYNFKEIKIDKLLADKWYWNEENYIYLKENQILWYIPHPENNWVSLDDFIYDKEKDTYTDKEWNIFKFK